MANKEAAPTYFRAWQARDFDELRTVLADDADFVGPLGTADQLLKGLEGMASILTGIEVRKVIADGDDVMTWYDLSTSVAPTVPCVNWMHFENGKIVSVRAAFDARRSPGALAGNRQPVPW